MKKIRFKSPSEYFQGYLDSFPIYKFKDKQFFLEPLEVDYQPFSNEPRKILILGVYGINELNKNQLISLSNKVKKFIFNKITPIYFYEESIDLDKNIIRIRIETI